MDQLYPGVKLYMKGKDTHVLDWRKIAKSSLKEFSQASGSPNNHRAANKGILFEDVIEKLLLAMFPAETWKRTGQSHDGKRDFVYPAEEYLKEQKWAECKNYNSNLSINVIAPTLIMGAIKGIECIFFFSYSPLNDTAVENLLRYSKIERSIIKIFDGNLLESLICRYHAVNGLEKFFPNTDFEKVSAELEKRPFRIIKTLWDLNGNAVPSTHRFELGESFYFHVAIQNLTWKSEDCEISFQAGNQEILRCEEHTYTQTLPFAEIKGYSVLCEVLSPGNTTCMARVTVNGKQRKYSTKISVIDEPYLAWSGEDALQAQKDGSLHLAKKDLRPLFIVGQSGTGKSTLTEILLQQEQIQKSYRILKIDLTLARNVCIRNLFSQIFGMRGKEATPSEQTADDDEALSLLVGSYAASAGIIAQTLMEFYNSDRPYLFVIDDIQKISRPYISLIQELEDRAQEKNRSIYYLFALNEEEISLDELLSQLNWDTNYQNRECHIVRTTRFQRKDILAYLKTRYGLEDIDPYFDGFDRDINPLDLHIFCAGLKKERVIAQVPGGRTYQIIRPFQFSEGVQQILYADIPLKKICSQMNQGGQAEFLLKFLYIADALTPKMEAKHTTILQGLIDQGILREKDGSITFYHDKVRSVIGNTFVFSEEDYADIFADPDTDEAAKAICALEQIGHLRNGSAFLENFFALKAGIRKGEQRHQIGRLIFQHLEELSDVGLVSVALQFVRDQFSALREEQGHKTFFTFLKYIADSALTCVWDIDDQCTENMAFFIKKYFDRALSTYNDQNCLDYFQKFEKIFENIKHISNSRRNFWLSHYANRAAISLDRRSTPSMAEPTAVTELYRRSEAYRRQADEQNQLILQITVDNFNRHYVYRHDLTQDIINDSFKELCQLKDNGMEDSMVLDYHLLLLEYLRGAQTGSSDEQDVQDLWKRVRSLRQKSSSAFYTIKLYFLELTILARLHLWEEANKCLSQALEFAYKKEMRPYVYKLTYIRTHLIILEEGHKDSPDVYRQAILALEQMIDTHRNMVQNLERETFLLVRLMRIITASKPDEISGLISHYSPDTQKLLNAIYAHIQGDSTTIDELLHMRSFYIVDGVDFPTI